MHWQRLFRFNIILLVAICLILPLIYVVIIEAAYGSAWQLIGIVMLLIGFLLAGFNCFYRIQVYRITTPSDPARHINTVSSKDPPVSATNPAAVPQSVQDCTSPVPSRPSSSQHHAPVDSGRFDHSHSHHPHSHSLPAVDMTPTPTGHDFSSAPTETAHHNHSHGHPC